MNKYQITYGYKAVISIQVKADGLDEAKLKADKEIQKMRTRIINGSTCLEDDSYRIGGDGIVDLTLTWDEL